MIVAFFLLLSASASFEDSFRAGLLALQRGNLRQAATELEIAAKLAPANSHVWVALSQTYRRRGDGANADRAARKAVALTPGDSVVLQSLEVSYFEAAQPLLKRQQFSEALAVLEPGVKLLPGSAQLQLALGVARYGLRRYDAAAEAFFRTIQIDAEIEQPYLFLGKFLDQIPERRAEASGRFLEYEKAHPASPTGYLLHAKVAEPKEAAKLIEKALTIRGDDAAAHFDLASAYDAQSRFEEASQEFERSIALDSSSSAAHYRLARDYDRLGKHEAAQLERERHALLVKTEGGMQ